MNNKDRICQSCCMPVNQSELFGTEANGEKNLDYCIHCYKDGCFTQPDSTLEIMIDVSAKIWAEKDPNVTVDQAKEVLLKKMPTLKRWCV